VEVPVPQPPVVVQQPPSVVVQQPPVVIVPGGAPPFIPPNSGDAGLADPKYRALLEEED